MDKVARADGKDRADLFRLTADRMRFHPVNIEKDFWVCWLLKQLFTIQAFEGWLVFKGGTSLSKCFNLIRRFSEDIDLAVSFERLGFTGDRDPRQARLSHSKRQPLLEAMLGACREYVADAFLGTLQARIKEVLGPRGEWKLGINAADPNTVGFEYPSALEARLDYIRPSVTLELGTHAEPIPHGPFPIRPFIAREFPDLFSESTCLVTAVVARRTFWEKATILHAEYHRPPEKPMIPRYWRHYADVASMSQTSVKDEALADLELLRSVVMHKDRFYHCGWAKYQEARPGSFRLAPRDFRLPELRKDSQAMRTMFYEDPPAIEDVLRILARLEREINHP